MGTGAKEIIELDDERLEYGKDRVNDMVTVLVIIIVVLITIMVIEAVVIWQISEMYLHEAAKAKLLIGFIETIRTKEG